MRSSLDRRGFFRRMTGEPLPQRPPWALPERRFVETCDGCGACIRDCPHAILAPGAGKLPQIDFNRDGCTFCGRCVEACTPGALHGGPPAPAWTLIARISAACLEPKGIACRACETACDAAALRFRPVPGGKSQVIVAEDRCTGCGACVSICPAGAIAIATPDQHHQARESAA